MPAPISKIQFLTDSREGQPIYYCHREDRDHLPALDVRLTAAGTIRIGAMQALFKVKANPATQQKNRVDIYMSLAEARGLGTLLTEVAQCDPQLWQTSQANPSAARRGSMELPHIEWAKVARFGSAKARVRPELTMEATNGYFNVDLEYPHPTHVKMADWEVHIGLTLNPAIGQHIPLEAIPVHVPDGELQRPKSAASETNPVDKVRGDFFVILSRPLEAGLGLLLGSIVPPAPPALRTADA